MKKLSIIMILLLSVSCSINSKRYPSSSLECMLKSPNNSSDQEYIVKILNKTPYLKASNNSQDFTAVDIVPTKLISGGYEYNSVNHEFDLTLRIENNSKVTIINKQQKSVLSNKCQL